VSATDVYRSNFGSYHPGICQFIHADTSLRVLDVTLDAAVLGELTTCGE
jgi:hypothetical protein